MLVLLFILLRINIIGKNWDRDCWESYAYIITIFN
jgi:hypothetical protein